MLILRYGFLWILLAFIAFLVLKVVTTPILRRRTINRKTIKSATLGVIAALISAAFLAFIILTE